MSDYDFQRDLENSSARKNYDAAMNGEIRKGVELFEKPHLWDEERPCDIKDTPTDNFIPTPEMDSGGFSSYSIWGKISTILGFCIFAAIIFLVIYALYIK